MDFDSLFENVGKAVDGVGVAITALGAAAALIAYGIDIVRRASDDASYQRVRRRLGRAILLGLEFLVAGDIIRSVVVSPSFRSVGVLAVIVVIRSFLSVTLEMEIGGRLPWRRDAATGDSTPSATAAATRPVTRPATRPATGA